MDNGDAPATKGDVKTALDALEERLTATMRDIETNLLKAFYAFTESNQKRMVQIEGNQGAFVSRLATLEQRVTEVEKRLNIPPAG